MPHHFSWLLIVALVHQSCFRSPKVSLANARDLRATVQQVEPTFLHDPGFQAQSSNGLNNGVLLIEGNDLNALVRQYQEAMSDDISALRRWRAFTTHARFSPIDGERYVQIRKHTLRLMEEKHTSTMQDLENQLSDAEKNKLNDLITRRFSFLRWLKLRESETDVASAWLKYTVAQRRAHDLNTKQRVQESNVAFSMKSKENAQQHLEKLKQCEQAKVEYSQAFFQLKEKCEHLQHLADEIYVELPTAYDCSSATNEKWSQPSREYMLTLERWLGGRDEIPASFHPFLATPTEKQYFENTFLLPLGFTDISDVGQLNIQVTKLIIDLAKDDGSGKETRLECERKIRVLEMMVSILTNEETILANYRYQVLEAYISLKGALARSLLNVSEKRLEKLLKPIVEGKDAWADEQLVKMADAVRLSSVMRHDLLNLQAHLSVLLQDWEKFRRLQRFFIQDLNEVQRKVEAVFKPRTPSQGEDEEHAVNKHKEEEMMKHLFLDQQFIATFESAMSSFQKTKLSKIIAVLQNRLPAHQFKSFMTPFLLEADAFSNEMNPSNRGGSGGGGEAKDGVNDKTRNPAWVNWRFPLSWGFGSLAIALFVLVGACFALNALVH